MPVIRMVVMVVDVGRGRRPVDWMEWDPGFDYYLGCCNRCWVFIIILVVAMSVGDSAE
jgi:hypothetical protein